MNVVIEQTRDIALCRALRAKVFIEEQGVAEADERDDKDEEAIHLLLREQGVALGSARLILGDGYLKIGRVCVLAPARGRGHGAALIRAGIDCARGLPGVSQVTLGAQIQALGFYERLGFTAIGPVFDDAGISHRQMVLTL